MGKYPVYAIVGLIFLGIIKLIQVTSFDAEKYKKSKESFYDKPKKIETPSKTPKPAPTENQSIVEEDTLAFDSTTSNADTQTIEPQDEVEDSFENATGSNDYSSSSNYEGLSDLKNIYLAPKIANLPPGQLRDDVVIRYYKHEQDGDKVFVLHDMGYYIHEKKATETAGLGSNVIYYGKDVAIEDIQIVAFTLLAEGLPIKSIEPSSYSWKADAIEIGTDPDLLESVNLTEEDVRKFTK